MNRFIGPSSLLVALLSLSACLVPADNPCDPDADDSIQDTGSLSGVVLDQNDEPVAGVTVVISARGDTTTSAADGTFDFEGVPPTSDGYELVAFPPEPALGGTVTTDPVACRADVEGVTLHVVEPPPAPEVELVKATAADRMFVAFGSAGADASYTLELRAPFEPWTPAVLVKDSLLAATADDEVPLYAEGDEVLRAKSDALAKEACSVFAYAEPSLTNDNARCAEVGGAWVDGQVQPLVPYGSYQVRVRAERPVNQDLLREQLPERVRSPDATVPGRMSLVPTAVLPVMMGTDADTQAARESNMHVHAIVPTGQGRFAMVDGDAMSVIGLGEVLGGSLYDTDGAPADAMVLDESATTEASAEITSDDGRALAILPAGRWVRVWKQKSDGLGGVTSQVDKVFVGAEERTEPSAPAGVEPDFDLDVAAVSGLEDFRGFDWLWIPSGSVTEATYNPPDAYMLLFRQGFVFLERERVADGVPAVLTNAFETDLGDGTLDGEWAEDDLGGTAGADGALCSSLGDGVEGSDGAFGERTTRVCYDLESARGEQLDLVASAILPEVAGDNARDKTFNLLVDRGGDRVFAARTDRFLGESAGAVLDALTPVRVGVRPGAVAVTSMLDCEDGTNKPVALVANAGSLDVSVLEARDGAVSEITSLGLPGVPTNFLRDPAGVTCADPFVWVQADDGHIFPVDMRSDRFGFPLCGDEPCVVDTRGRADAGGVSRNAVGSARVLIGGRGMLGELGYLRPSR